MLHSVSGGCYGNKQEMAKCIAEIESLEDSLGEMYAQRMGMSKEEVKAQYFDGTDHWLTAQEALQMGLIDGIYDADPVAEDSTPVVAVFAQLRKLLRVVNTEDVVYGDVYDHHEYELESVGTSGRENTVAVVSFGEIAPHFGDGPILTNLDDRFVGSGERIENLSVNGGIVVGKLYELAHIYIV